jgi:hypothetical protein
MNNKIQKLIDECRNYIPLDGRILVYAEKIRQVKQSDYTFDLADTKANEGKDPSKHRVDLKKVQPMINAKYQRAVVLQVPFDEHRFKVGDTVIYPIGAIQLFDQIKGVSVLRKYDIAAVLVNHEILEDEDTKYLTTPTAAMSFGPGLTPGLDDYLVAGDR